MGELKEKIWAVISERGCEARGVDYTEAKRLVGRLKDERVSGLCVVTGTAARHVAPAQTNQSSKPSNRKASPTTR